MMIIMFSPVSALVLFLFLPFRTAVPIYIPIFIFGVIVNFKMMKSMSAMDQKMEIFSLADSTIL